MALTLRGLIRSWMLEHHRRLAASRLIALRLAWRWRRMVMEIVVEEWRLVAQVESWLRCQRMLGTPLRSDAVGEAGARFRCGAVAGATLTKAWGHAESVGWRRRQ